MIDYINYSKNESIARIHKATGYLMGIAELSDKSGKHFYLIIEQSDQECGTPTGVTLRLKLTNTNRFMTENLREKSIGREMVMTYYNEFENQLPELIGIRKLTRPS
jgi:hypothetical protein